MGSRAPSFCAGPTVGLDRYFDGPVGEFWLKRVIADAAIQQEVEERQATGASDVEGMTMLGRSVPATQVCSRQRATRYPRPRGPDVNDAQHEQE